MLISLEITLVVSDSMRPAKLLCPWDSLGKNTGVSCHVLLQGIFLTQGLNLQLLTSPALPGRFFTSRASWEPLEKL